MLKLEIVEGFFLAALEEKQQLLFQKKHTFFAVNTCKNLYCLQHVVTFLNEKDCRISQSTQTDYNLTHNWCTYDSWV